MRRSIFDSDDRLPPLMRLDVRNWMLQHAHEHLDECGDVNTTRLAEEAAHEFEHDEWLDIETHEVWELALDAERALHARQKRPGTRRP